MRQLNCQYVRLSLKALVAASIALAPVTIGFADDNLIAHRLFQQGNHAEAAEIYTDPSWKGIALYRSSQWWRAAEAFIRADDAASLHNLGNTYVQMSYYALALEAYQQALVKQPDFEDARFNADLMRKLLSSKKDDQGQSALERKGDEIDRVESDGDEQPGGSNDEESDQPQDREDTGEDREGDTDDRGPAPEAVAAGDSSEAGSDDTMEDNGDPDGGTTKGTEADTQEQSNPSTGAEGSDSTSDAQAASMRASLEAAQADEQWLNQINHDAKRYLQKRIELEIARRQASGQNAPEGGSPW